MAESSSVAVGRYLRQLRERRGLSLARVCELTRGSSEPMDKGTLSRLERGQQAPSLFRLGPLCRIYEIPAGALIEQIELDRELEHVGGPETEGKAYEQLHEAGVAAMVSTNRKWESYAFFRDALPLAPPERRVFAWINLTTAIRSLGKNTLALHELREIEATAPLDPAQRALVHERLSNCCRCLGEMHQAELEADTAIRQAQAIGDLRILAHAYATRGSAAVDQAQWDVASDVLLKALAAYREAAKGESRLRLSPSFEPQTLLMLAECALGLRRFSRTRRLALAANRLAGKHDLPVGLAYSEVLLGWVDEAEGRIDRALDRWRKATALARRINYPRIEFTAEVELLRQALESGDRARARVHRRRLERLAPWIPPHIPAYRRYKQLVEGDPPLPKRAQEETHHVPSANDPDAVDGHGARLVGGKRPARRRRRVAAEADRSASDVR